MKRKYLNTLLALVALGLLWGGITVYNRRARKNPPASSAKPEAKVFNLNPKDVEEFTLTPSGGEPLTLSKENNTWTIIEPRKLPASQENVTTFLNDLTGAAVDEVVAVHPSSLKDYGLEPPSETVSLTTDSKPLKQELLLGDETPTSSGVYAQVAGNDRVILIADYLKSALEKKLFDLRDKRAVTLNLDDVSRIEVASKNENYTLEKDAQGTWNVVLPPPVRADRFSVDSMVDQLRDLSMQSIAAESHADPAKYGFAKPALKVLLTAGHSSQTLIFGKEEEGRYDAMNTALDPVFTLGTNIVSTFVKDPGSLRDKSLFSFSSFEAKRVEAETPKGHYVFEKQKNQWKMIAPASIDEPSDSMEDLLDALSELQAQSFPSKNPTNLAAYGLTKPTYTLTVEFGTKNKSETVEAATVGEHLYARRSTDRVPSELPLNALDSAMKALSKL